MPDQMMIRLYDNQDTTNRIAIELDGSRAAAGADVAVEAVIITLPGPRRETYTVTGALSAQAKIPSSFIDDTLGITDVRFKLRKQPPRRNSALGLHAAAPSSSPTRASGSAAPSAPGNPAKLASASPALVVLAALFVASNPQFGVEVRLTLNLPGTPTGGVEPPVAVLSVRGHVEVAAGAGVFTLPPITLSVLIDALPTGFPSASIPGLSIILPGDIPWPEVRLPWPDFPKLPGLTQATPLKLPAMSVDLAPLPLRLGWTSVVLSADPTSGVATANVNGLGIVGPIGTISGSFDLQFDALGVTIPFAKDFPAGFPKAGTTPPTPSPYMFISFGADGFGIDWTSGSAAPLIGLFSAELADKTQGSADEMKLRVRTSGRELEEIRLDWGEHQGPQAQAARLRC